MIEKINEPKDLKNISYNEKEELAKDIRKLIIETVSKNGGHLASNLGVVELTIALHAVFDAPKDKIIWDVGHQSYVHKILTGRKDKFETLRKFNGISGFPKTKESVYDCFDTGHSSTSISVGLGMARARDLLNENYKIISIIGDGALTGGMAQEALNDAGCSKTNIIVILNDNEMSISENVGGTQMLLTKLRTKRFYNKSNNSIKAFFDKLPLIGKPIISLVRKIKRGIKQLILKNMYFEDIGFKYLGPVDGHDIEKLESILKLSKEIDRPVLVHIITKKGKEYKFAEETPDKFHSTAPFEIETGKLIKNKTKDYSKVFGDKLIKIAKKDNKIVAVTAAMEDGTGLSEFAKTFPNRFFDVGIAEQHAIGLIAGMAKAGLKPVLPIYSSFLQRSYDQIIHDIAIQKLPVTICVDRAGLVGNDGETHQGIFDLSFLNTIPNLTIMAPKNFEELEKMLEFAVNLDKPAVIRYPRGGEGEIKFKKCEKVKLGKAEVIKEGKDITIIAIGKMVSRAIEVSDLLTKAGKTIEVINARFLKPFDKEIVLDSIQKTKNVITIEDGILENGLGTKVIELINNSNLKDIKVKRFGYKDFIEQGTIKELEEKYGLSVKTIYNKISTLHN